MEAIETTPDVVYENLKIQDYWPSAPFRRRYYFWNRIAHEDYRYHQALRRRTRMAVESFRPDVVHSLHVHAFGGINGIRLPIVVSAYGLEVEPIPPVLASVGQAKVVHAISEFTAGLVRARLPRPPKISVITWGIRMDAGQQKLEPPEFDLVTVARLVRRKNIDTVLRAVRTIGDLRYAIVGDGPEMPALRDLASSLGLTNVTFLGAVADAERRRVLARSRLFVMCPRLEPGDIEGLGLVYFEALASGLPIVASNNGGVPEAVGSAGLLVDHPDDPIDLARAIQCCLDPVAYAKFMVGVRERQHSSSWDGFLDAFQKLYLETSDGRGMSGSG